jgi:hypothetical protein
MPERRFGGGVRRERKELPTQAILDAWWGDAEHPWQCVITGEDGRCLRPHTLVAEGLIH